MFKKAFHKFSERVSSFSEATTELKDDPDIQPLRNNLKGAVTRYLVEISTAQAKGKETAKERTPSADHIHCEHSTKFDIELPSFSGKPRDWKAFYDLFLLNLLKDALINNYGSPTIIYPHYVRELVMSEVYTYNRDGLRRLRQRYLLN